MNFDVGTPIWRQLFDEFSRLIAAGQWPPGSQIPSVRELAAAHGVNPNTVQKALVELERVGVAETRRGLGRYVTDNAAAIRSLGRRLACEAARIFVADMKTLAVDLPEAEALVKTQWKGDKDANAS